MLQKIKNIFKPKKIVLKWESNTTTESNRTLCSILGLAIAIAISAKVTGFNFDTLIKRGNQFFVILKEMSPPDFSFAKKVITATYRNNKNFYFRIYDRKFYSNSFCNNMFS